MNFIYTARKMEVRDVLKERVEKKLSKLDKFFDSDSEAHVIFAETDKGLKTFEVVVSNRGLHYRTQQHAKDMFDAIDEAVAHIIRQIRKNKTRLEKHLRDDAFEYHPEENEMDYEHKEFIVIKTKNFDLKPMDVEEAILQMNLLGHDFFVFRDTNTEETNVVYRRKDGNFGLITSD